MALEELMGFTNSASTIIGFSLLLIALAVNFSQLNVTALIANSESFATALGPRLISSPNCFAYTYYSGNSTDQASVVIPGYIDVRKLQQDQFFSCLQYIYSYQASLIPLNGYLIDAAVGVNVFVEDVTQPYNLRPVYLSNIPQYQVGQAFNGVRSSVGTTSTILEITSFIASFAINLALMIASAGIASFISLNLAAPVGENFYTSYFSTALTISNILNEPVYTETFPVVLQFSNSQGEPTFENYGYMTISIRYALYPYAGNHLVI